MISVCIPIYNFDVTTLVKELHRQASDLKIPFQILLMDDASIEEFRIKNQGLNSLKNVEYIQLEKNVGRSMIRNLLVDKALYPYLIFLDCDSMVVYDDFLNKYLAYCYDGIVCTGGRAYLDIPKEKKFILHWQTGVNKEVIPLNQRKLQPNKSFLTCNFLIDKEIFKTVRFDERLTEYGHEDTLFGIELDRAGIVIQHIDNPAYHIGLEPANEFLEKIENGIRNLHKIDRLLNHDPKFIQSVTLMRFYYRLKKYYLLPVMSFSFKIFRTPVRKNLFGKHPSMKLYDYYKIGYLCYTRNWPNE